MPRNNRGTRNNNPSGRNQYSDWGVMEMARERPLAAAAAAASAAAAGLFLWSRRTQISNQLTGLSDQIGGWTQNMRSGGGEVGGGVPPAGSTTTGGSNAGVGTRNGGAGMSSTAGGSGRAQKRATS